VDAGAAQAVPAHPNDEGCRRADDQALVEVEPALGASCWSEPLAQGPDA
jgi:hypothetical protein